MPDGARSCAAECGQTNDGPVMEQGGSAATVRVTSLDSWQPLVWTTVKRKIAVAENTCAVVRREPGDSIVAVPVTTLQVVEAIGAVPAEAVPVRENVVESPSLQRV